MAVFKFYPKHRIRQGFDNCTRYLDRFFFRHTSFRDCDRNRVGCEVPKVNGRAPGSL
jgi:hypothetical protein